MSASNIVQNPLKDFQARFEALENKLYFRLLEAEKALKDCQQLHPVARRYSFEEIKAGVGLWMAAMETIAATGEQPAPSSHSSADFLQLKLTYPFNGPLSAYSAFQIAIAYWIEAEVAFRQGDHTRTLPALIVCSHYLGMACAPLTTPENLRAVRTDAHADDTRLHRAQAVCMLNELEQGGGAKGVEAMLEEIGFQFELFNNSVDHHWRSKSPQELLKDWCQHKDRAPEVYEAWLAAKGAWRRAKKKITPPKRRNAVKG